MSSDPIDYPHLVQNALRGMVRDVLRQVEQHGLPGVHHFYVTYDTRHPDVALSEDLKARYPERITIILQHDFRELVVEEDRFSVILHFGGMPQRIRVPFEALATFYDPSEEFALQFDPVLPRPAGPELVEVPAPEAEPGSLRIPVRAMLEDADRMQAEKEAAEPEPAEAEPAAVASPQPALAELEADEPEAEADDREPAASDEDAAAAASDETPDHDETPDNTPDNVVSIDAFRRK